MAETSGTFGGVWDRLTFIIAEAQLLVAGTMVTIGLILLWTRPDVPGIPAWVGGVAATFLLFGPPLFGFFVFLLRRFRNRHRVQVHHINGEKDIREKYMVAPEIWSEKTVNGPSPYVVNEGDGFEVREFDWHEDMEELTVRGCYMSQLADSKLVTVKTMFEDIHGDLIDAYLELNRLRGRISKMGLEIQSDVINEEAEADERGLMNPRTTVRDRFEGAKKDAEDRQQSEIKDVTEYTEEYAEEHDLGMPATTQTTAATDGGNDE